MVAPYLLSSSTVVTATPQVAYDGVMNAPLEVLFPHRSGMIPPVKESTGQNGPWADVGQTRTVVLADGSSNLETLVEADRAGGSYRYRLTDFTGPMKALVASIDGRFAYVAEGDRTRVTWSWSINPTNAVAKLALPVVGAFWKRYAAKMWPKYAAQLPG